MGKKLILQKLLSKFKLRIWVFVSSCFISFHQWFILWLILFVDLITISNKIVAPVVLRWFALIRPKIASSVQKSMYCGSLWSTELAG
jgi:hypothetical protein